MNRNDLLVPLLILLQLVATVFLWTLDASGAASQTRFAIFLAVDLLSFAMVTYVYRKTRWGELAHQIWILIGSFALAILLIACLILP